mmetsp:Transcript_38452/g.94200  ORF Transcript_38452/g.94200 Transcript_38452/m.94200 type:complete len:280 (-) Transcript_38452:279-1118(-)
MRKPDLVVVAPPAPKTCSTDPVAATSARTPRTPRAVESNCLSSFDTSFSSSSDFGSRTKLTQPFDLLSNQQHLLLCLHRPGHFSVWSDGGAGLELYSCSKAATDTVSGCLVPGTKSFQFVSSTIGARKHVPMKISRIAKVPFAGSEFVVLGEKGADHMGNVHLAGTNAILWESVAGPLYGPDGSATVPVLRLVNSDDREVGVLVRQPRSFWDWTPPPVDGIFYRGDDQLAEISEALSDTVSQCFPHSTNFDLTFKQELAPAEKAMLLGSVMLLDYSAYE